MATLPTNKVWLLKHPLSLNYKETQTEIKREAMIARAKIFDIKLASKIDPSLVVEHTLTDLNDKPKKKAAPRKKAEPVSSDPAEE